MRISFVASVCVPFDAISASVRANVRWAMEAGHDVRLFTGRCEYDDLPATVVPGPGELASDPFFRTSDLVVLSFGIYYTQFAALVAAPTGARVVVQFHNVTPRELLPSWHHEVIDLSMQQIALMRFVDEVFCISEVNLAFLRERGVRAPALVRRLAIDVPLDPPPAKPSHSDGVLRIAFLGRFVRSKGPLELLVALDEALPEISQDRVELSMVGNTDFSDADHLREVQAAASRLERASGGRLTVTILGNAQDAHRNEVLRESDLFVLPTYHEGFCVPVVEAFASGCDIVTYDNSNLPVITNGMATLVPTGDVEALSEALRGRAEVVGSQEWQRSGYADHVDRAARYVAEFAPERVRDQFLADLAG
ncbi:glycosyltransferase family 4 protein [Cellulomonas wangsupingiae]|uniref:Glycosyltransferase family 4 protein n=1 Tax=Cellulomonas wangsupingiae TaxID=2968085 RepID=A0ABY5K2B7_9CELL|nr:glycosyltransferase family 4 protein [Cellulomonas wangsupingiae]MCC2335698.1 glycosyltransferase family 4 protein [Cellulomonas wangsupingiae]UUI63933.1 glycosyltransferase family 4 protein [Cellulomonas wangsupingiae]